MSRRVYRDNELTLEIRRLEREVRVVWTGRSTAREPMTFIGPIIAAAMQESTEAQLLLVLDLRALTYMNSSTLTPVIRLLREANRGQQRVLVIYQSTARWQELSFSALTAFTTKDGRVEIRGEP